MKLKFLENDYSFLAISETSELYSSFQNCKVLELTENNEGNRRDRISLIGKNGNLQITYNPVEISDDLITKIIELKYGVKIIEFEFNFHFEDDDLLEEYITEKFRVILNVPIIY